MLGQDKSAMLTGQECIGGKGQESLLLGQGKSLVLDRTRM
jgi:hypothetical protein